MPRRPKREEGMEQPKRARRRKPETAKANLEPPLKELRRTGCPPRGGIRRVCGEVPGRSQWRLLQGRTGRPKVGQGRACTMEAKAFSFTHFLVFSRVNVASDDLYVLPAFLFRQSDTS